MKKQGPKGQTGNPARRRRGASSPPRKPWSRWLGREMEAFFNLPYYLGELILLVVAVVAVSLWRWLMV